MREGGREGAAGRRGNGSAASAVKAGDVAQDLISDLGESSPGQRAGDELERAATCAALYNTLLPSLQSATPPERWSDLRWHRFRELARKVDVCEQSMRAYFEDVARQPFLLGQTGGKFRADLTWLLEFEHFLAVAEGRYTDRDDD